jgi:hypothetical protein
LRAIDCPPLCMCLSTPLHIANCQDDKRRWNVIAGESLIRNDGWWLELKLQLPPSLLKQRKAKCTLIKQSGSYLFSCWQTHWFCCAQRLIAQTIWHNPYCQRRQGQRAKILYTPPSPPYSQRRQRHLLLPLCLSLTICIAVDHPLNLIEVCLQWYGPPLLEIVTLNGQEACYIQR